MSGHTTARLRQTAHRWALLEAPTGVQAVLTPKMTDQLVERIEAALPACITDLETALLAATDLAKRQCERIEEFERTFDLQWKADQRAIAKWQAAHPGNDLVWPDRADHFLWMIGRIEELEAERDARPVVRWVACREDFHEMMWGPLLVAEIWKGDAWFADFRSPRSAVWSHVKNQFDTPEAAKAAVEEALRGLSAKTEGV